MSQFEHLKPRDVPPPVYDTHEITVKAMLMRVGDVIDTGEIITEVKLGSKNVTLIVTGEHKGEVRRARPLSDEVTVTRRVETPVSVVTRMLTDAHNACVKMIDEEPRRRQELIAAFSERVVKEKWASVSEAIAWTGENTVRREVELDFWKMVRNRVEKWDETQEPFPGLVTLVCQLADRAFEDAVSYSFATSTSDFHNAVQSAQHRESLQLFNPLRTLTSGAIGYCRRAVRQAEELDQ